MVRMTTKVWEQSQLWFKDMASPQAAASLHRGTERFIQVLMKHTLAAAVALSLQRLE